MYSLFKEHMYLTITFKIWWKEIRDVKQNHWKTLDKNETDVIKYIDYILKDTNKENLNQLETVYFNLSYILKNHVVHNEADIAYGFPNFSSC